MIEIQKAMNNEGFFPRDIQADGKIHRFKKDSQDKGKSAWYIAHQNHTVKGGELFYVALWADWHDPDNLYKFCSLTTQSTVEKLLIEDQIRKAERKRTEEQEKVWAETAEKAKKVFDELSQEGSTPYLEKKKIDSLYGARIDGDLLAVPVCDIDGKIWGLQKIFPDGKKLFMSGTKKRGNFHVLRTEQSIDQSEIIYVCEGFATAASVRAATGKTTVCTFDSGNIDSVCSNIRSRFRDVSLVICGDNDIFTQLPDGTPINPGRTKAEDAAKKFLGKAIFPDFGYCEEKLTDWNDLHVLRGLDAVREQILGIKVEKHYIIPLGHKGSTYFYTSNRNKQIMPLTAHGADQLLDLQPLNYWEQLYTTKLGIDWKQAQTDLKQNCWAKGIFNASNVRGLGVWMDEGRVIIHLGNRLWVDGQEIDLHSLKSRYIYSLEETQSSITGNPLNASQCKILIDLIQSMAWHRTQDAIYFLGWLVSSHICGILPWRPHMWLVGSSGAGKSTLYELLSKLHHYELHNFGGGTTEAGLRRSVRGSAIAVIFDEFELNNANTLATNQSILAFMRQASSETVAKVVKAEGQSGTVSYDPRFCAFVSGIRPSVDNEADRNRFTIIELDRTKQNDTQWAKVVDLMTHIDSNFAQGLFMRSISLIKPYLKTRAIFEQVLSKRYYGRFAQQFAPILAGYVSLIQDSAMNYSDADDFVVSLKLEVEVEEIKGQSDEQEALNHLLSYRTHSDMGDRSVIEIIKAANSFIGDEKKQLAHEVLMRHGLKYSSETEALYIASKHPELTKIFDKTRFSVNWNFSLARIQDAKKNQSLRLFDKVCKGVAIPVKNIL